MKSIILLLVLLVSSMLLRAQYVFVLRGDSVKITNCDSSELILENHTQGVKGFLYNRGNGRTEFRRGAMRINDSLLLIGDDTIRISASGSGGTAWLVSGNSGTNSTGNFLGTLDSASLVFRTNNAEQARFGGSSGNLMVGTTTDNGERLQVNGMVRAAGAKVFPSGTIVPITIQQAPLQRIPNIMITDSAGREAARIYADPYGEGYAFGQHAAYGARGNFIAIGTNTIGGNAYGGTANYTGRENVAVGDYALASITSGSANVAFGQANLEQLSLGNFNVGIGSAVMYNLVSGSSNIGIGDEPLANLNSGWYNIGIGDEAGFYNVNGFNNVFIGKSAGQNNLGSGNVFVGYNAGMNETGSGYLYIDHTNTASPLLYGDFNNRLFRTNSTTFQATGDAYFGGTTTPTATVHVAASTGAAGTAPVKLTSGTLLSTTEAGAIEYDGSDLYLTNSTARYKLVKAFAGTLSTSFGGGSLAAGASITATLTVTGAQSGDVVVVNASTANPAAIMISAYVSSTNTVTIRAYNAGSSAVTLASDTYKVRIIE